MMFKFQILTALLSYSSSVFGQFDRQWRPDIQWKKFVKIQIENV